MKLHFAGRRNPRAEEFLTRLLGEYRSNNVHILSINFDYDRGDTIPRSDFRVLVIWEPRCVIPWQYIPSNLQKFDLIIPMSPWRAENMGLNHYSFQPYDPSGQPTSPWINRNKRLVMINAAKFSGVTSSNYGLRRRTLGLLQNSGSSFELYGHDWIMPKRKELAKRYFALRDAVVSRSETSFRESFGELFKSYHNYKGSIQDKFTVLQDSEMVLIIENECDDVTEKIFDAIWAGAVPIYVGPYLGDIFPDLEECVIRCDPNEEAILSKVMEVSEDDLIRCKKSIENYLNIEGPKGLGFWASSSIWSSVAGIITDILGSNRDIKTSL